MTTKITYHGPFRRPITRTTDSCPQATIKGEAPSGWERAEVTYPDGSLEVTYPEDYGLQGPSVDPKTRLEARDRRSELQRAKASRETSSTRPVHWKAILSRFVEELENRKGEAWVDQELLIMPAVNGIRITRVGQVHVWGETWNRIALWPITFADDCLNRLDP